MAIQKTTGPKKINLIPLGDLSTELQLNVRNVRNEKEIRRWMYTDHIIGLNEHLDWINQIRNDKQKMVFVIMNEGVEILGIVSLNRVDTLHKSTDWAYYLTKSARGGLGSAIEYSFINFIFDKLDIQKLNCEVVAGNDAVIKLHKKFLFEEEGFRRSNIIKEGKRIGVHFLGLTKEDWDAGKENLFEKYKNIFDKFSIAIQWNEANLADKKHPIDEIEAARARNNLNWMNILRLVLELSPEHGKALVKDIRDIDKEVSDLTDKLISLE